MLAWVPKLPARMPAAPHEQSGAAAPQALTPCLIANTRQHGAVAEQQVQGFNVQPARGNRHRWRAAAGNEHRAKGGNDNE